MPHFDFSKAPTKLPPISFCLSCSVLWFAFLALSCSSSSPITPGEELSGCDYRKQINLVSFLQFDDPELDEITLSGSHVVGIGEGTVFVVDVSDPRSPELVGQATLPEWCELIVSRGQFAFVATRTGVTAVDISTPASPRAVSRLDLADITKMKIRNGELLCAYGNKLAVVDISDLLDMKVSRVLEAQGDIASFEIHEDLILISTYNGPLLIYNYMPFDPAQAIGAIQDFSFVPTILSSPKGVYISLGTRIYELDVSTAWNPRLKSFVETPQSIHIAVEGDYLFFGGTVTLGAVSLAEEELVRTGLIHIGRSSEGVQITV